MPQIQITCDTSDASIYYTTDGNEPSSSSNLYSSPFEASTGSIIKALGIKKGYNNSDIAEFEVKLPKLPTPDGYLSSQPGAPENEQIIFLRNADSYPENSVIHYNYNNEWKSLNLKDLSIYISIGSYKTVQLYISCESYEDSDTITLSYS